MENKTVDRYLERLAVDRRVAPDLDTLALLHRRHLERIPFENLMIRKNLCPDLALEALEDKILFKRRGGICYELNGLFAALLQAIGFDVRMLGARVEEQGTFFDHLALCVRIDNTSYLVDVGFGDHFLEPISLEVGRKCTDKRGIFWWEKEEGTMVLWREGATGGLFCYALHPDARELQDFQERCFYYATAPDSRFRRGTILSRFTEKGRISLTDDRLLLTHGDAKRVVPVEDPQVFRSMIRRYFPELTGDWAP